MTGETPVRSTSSVSAAQAAEHLCMSTRNFRTLLDKGLVTKAWGRAYDLDTVRREYIEHLRGLVSGPARVAEGGPALDPVAERARKDAAMADRVELQNAVTPGELAPVRLFQSALEECFTRFRAKLRSAPSKLASVLEGATRPEIELAIKSAHDEALRELASEKFSPEAFEVPNRVEQHELPQDLLDDTAPTGKD